MADGEARRFFEFLLSEDVEDLNCSAVIAHLDRYVELAVDGRPMDVYMPGIAAHLADCEPCADQHNALRQLVQFEAEDRLPLVEGLWHEFRSLLQAPVGVGAGGAIAAATSPARPVPVPQGATFKAATHAARARGGFPGLPGSWRPQWLPVAAALTVVLLAVGWFRAERIARHGEGTMSALARASQVQFQRASGGAWARVYYGPTSEAMVVHAGDLPPLTDGKRLECWLEQRDGKRLLAAVLERVNPTAEWWVVHASQPARNFQTLALVLNNDGHHEPLVEVDLKPDPAR